MSLNSRIRLLRRKCLMLYRRTRYGFHSVHPTAYITSGKQIKKDIEMREYSFINVECVITAKVRIGRYALLGHRVAIIGDTHSFDIPGTPIIFSGMPEPKLTIIEDDAWVGFGSIIMSGVTIGRGAIVAAGSVVTRDIPPYEIHGGIPNKKIRDRFANAEEVHRHVEMLEGPTVTGQFNLPRKPATAPSQ